MSGQLLMGIDVGTFSSKGALCTPRGEVLASRQVEHGMSVPRPGWAEQDADGVWWADVCAISRALLDGTGISPDDVAAVGVSALGPDLVPLDAAGRALRPAILYGIDTRADREIAELNARFGEGEMFELSGMALSSQALGPKILWLRRNEPQIYAQTRYLHTASSFLAHRLSGEYVLDPLTAAFYNPLFDYRAGNWSDRWRAEIVGDVALPRLAWPGEPVGEVTAQAARETSLRAGTPVTVGGLDVLPEAISVGTLRPGELMLVYGTTACMVLVLDQPTPNPTMWLSPYAFPGTYCLIAGMATTGALTRWFRDHFAPLEMEAQAGGGPNAYAALTALAAEAPPGSEGLVILPYFSGERTPLNDSQARGVIAGLSLSHGRGHLYRAILEATAYGLAHNLEEMRSTGGTPRRVVAAGGGAQSDLLLQIVSDVTGLEQDVPAQTLGACYGDAFFAGLAAGLVSLAQFSQEWVQIERHFAPNEERRELYQAYYRVYRRLYPHTVEDVHTLAQLAGT